MKKDKDQAECLNKHSPQQQELIDIVNAELTEYLITQIELVSNLSERAFKSEELKQLLEAQIEFARRIDSVAEIIGLQGLHLFCEHIKINFELMLTQSYDQQSIIDSQLLYWPEIIQSYLLAPNDPDYIQEVLVYIKHEGFPIALGEQGNIRIREEFFNFSIQVDGNERIQKATPELVNLDVSEDIDSGIIENLMLDLPKQTERLSVSVRALCGDDYINQLKVSAKITHTLKGTGNTVGIQGIANLTHYMEDIFEVLLKSKMKPSNSLYETLRNTTECLEEMSEYLEGLGLKPENSVKVFQELLDWANSINIHGLTDRIELEVDSVPSNDEALANLEPSKQKERSNETPSDLPLRVSAKLVDDLLNSTGESIITGEQIAELVILLKSAIQNLVNNNKKVKLRAHEIENLIELRGLSNRLENQQVDTDLDLQETDQVDELHTSANKLVESTEDSFEFSNEIQNTLHLLEKHSLNQVRILQENQDAVLRIRMVPVQSIVPRLQRAVKQACKSSNKLVELKITGQNTLVDSEFIHQLADPIMHILRNAIDHGIEMPEKRAEQGKNAKGDVHLSFNMEGNTIHVACQDDGCGLDLNRIRTKAIENNLLSENEELDNENAIQMILRHGFSTKDNVSQISGRGVGLAAVHAKITEMKGSINIDTNEVNGINVEISIPTNLNTVHALLVSCDDSKVAISNRGIDEILYAGAGNIVSVSGKYYFEYIQQRYPVFDLRFMLEKTEQNKPSNNKVTLLVNDNVANKYAITIDKIHETRDIITKPINELIPNISGLLGTTILGDGTITTVVDIVELLNHAGSLEDKSTPSLDVKDRETHRHYALVVEDSISIRKSLAMFMQDLGFTVITAKDGLEALNQVQKKIPSVVITDLEMPRMNGLEFMVHLRSNEETAFTPIVMLTSKSSLKHKQEAERLGVTSCISKPYDEEELLEIINSLKLIDHVIA